MLGLQSGSLVLVAAKTIKKQIISSEWATLTSRLGQRPHRSADLARIPLAPSARVRAQRPSKPLGPASQIREMYVAELRARGLEIPTDPVLDAVADRLTRNPLPAVRLARESLARMGKAL